MCIWNQRDGGINLLGDGIERYAAKRASLFITNSGTGKDFLITKYGVSDDEIRVIHNGVKIDLHKCSLNHGSTGFYWTKAVLPLP